MMLNASAIIDAAERRIGMADPEPHLHRNLERLVEALNAQPRLLPGVEQQVHGSLVQRTADRLEGLKFLRDHPEIADERIEAPVFLTGLPRSGTTFFQYLFDRDTRFRLIRTWEGITPSPPPGFDPASVEQRKAEEEARREASRPSVPGFAALHLVDKDGPEECHAFMEHSYAAAGFHNLYRVPGYFDYLMDELDFDAAYRVHHRQLQLLQWRMPCPRWALKYPNHVVAMPAISRVYPGAQFVMTHRDPVQTLASIARMSAKLRGVRYAAVDMAEVGRQMLHFVQRHIDRIMAFTSGPDADRVTHVDYYRLLDDPAAAMLNVHAGLGIGSPDAVQQAVADWHKANPKNARGANDYSLGEFGLDDDAVAEQFGDYMRRFAIPRERVGLARAAAGFSAY